MGKARGPKRKQAPVRKRPPVKNNGALLAKQGWVQNGTKGTSMGGLEGQSSVGKQLTVPNKRSRGGKRRRKGDGPKSQHGYTPEAVAIQAEYAAVDAREKAKQLSKERQRLRRPVKIRLAPTTINLRMPSQGRVDSAQIPRGSSSALMVDALLESIKNDPAPDASLLRPVSSARRERSTNPFASLQEESDEEDNTTSLDKGSQAPISSVWGRGFAGFQFSSGGSAQAGEASSSENRAGSGGTVHFAAVRDDIDPDL